MKTTLLKSIYFSAGLISALTQAPALGSETDTILATVRRKDQLVEIKKSELERLKTRPITDEETAALERWDVKQAELDQNLALLILSKSLMEESRIASFPKNISSDIVRYVFRTIVVQNAISMERMTEKSNNVQFSDDQLYGWFLERIATAEKESGTQIPYIRLNIDWNYDAAGVGSMRTRLLSARPDFTSHSQSSNKFLVLDFGKPNKAVDDWNKMKNWATLDLWPEVSITLDRSQPQDPLLPPTAIAFQTLLKNKLQGVYQGLVRRNVWRGYVEGRYLKEIIHAYRDPMLSELKPIYTAVKNNLFTVDGRKANVEEYSAKGPLAKDFIKSMLQTLKALSKDALPAMEQKYGLNEKNADGSSKQLTQEQEKSLYEDIQALRRELPGRAFDAARVQYTAALSSQALSITRTPKTVYNYSQDGTRAPPGSDLAKMIDTVFNPLFGMSVLPSVENTKAPGVGSLTILYNIEKADDAVRSFEDPIVDSQLRQIYRAEKILKIYREALLDLFETSSINIREDLCAEDGTFEPCIKYSTATPENLVRALFGFNGVGRRVDTLDDLLHPGKDDHQATQRAFLLLDRAFDI